MLLVATLLFLSACAFAQPRIPPFLRGAPRYAVEEFQQIMADGTPKTYTQIMAELDEWMKTLPDDVQEKYARFKDYLRVRQAQMKIAHAASVARFSPAAKKVDAKLWAIANNQSLPALEKRRQIDAMLAASEPAIRQESRRKCVALPPQHLRTPPSLTRTSGSSRWNTLFRRP